MTLFEWFKSKKFKLVFSSFQSRKGKRPVVMAGVSVSTNPTPSKKEQMYRALDLQIGSPYLTFHGKCSHFGGKKDMGVSKTEDLAFFQNMDQVRAAGLSSYFIDPDDDNLARNLNPNSYYIACRWNYKITSKAFLLKARVLIYAPTSNKFVIARPIDWGPHERTGRSCDLSPGIMEYLNLRTDDYVEVYCQSPKGKAIMPMV